jgi:hypothetical protein
MTMNDRWEDEYDTFKKDVRKCMEGRPLTLKHPKLIEVGTMSVYLTYDEIRRLISVLQEGEALKDYLRGKQKEYERRMKDAT